MAENSKIQWTDHTWSPWRGCAKVSPGCTNCYAEKLSHRNPAVLGEWGVGAKRVMNADWNKPLAWDRAAAKLGVRHRVFPSLCDPFEDREDLDPLRIRLLELIAKTPNLDWLLLTKRPENWLPLMHRINDKWGTEGGHIAGRWLDQDVIPNVWLGVSVENQEYADERLPIIRKIPAAIRWVSYEPALGSVDFMPHLDFIDWVVVGGESGSDRPFDVGWACKAVDQCRAFSVAPFVKQLGRNPFVRTETPGEILKLTFEDSKGGDWDEWPRYLSVIKVREFPTAKGA